MFCNDKKIGHIQLLVYDISDAITFYTKKLGFSLSMKLRLILMDCILIVLGVILFVVRGLSVALIGLPEETRF